MKPDGENLICRRHATTGLPPNADGWKELWPMAGCDVVHGRFGITAGLLSVQTDVTAL